MKGPHSFLTNTVVALLPLEKALLSKGLSHWAVAAPCQEAQASPVSESECGGPEVRPRGEACEPPLTSALTFCLNLLELCNEHLRPRAAATRMCPSQSWGPEVQHQVPADSVPGKGSSWLADSPLTVSLRGTDSSHVSSSSYEDTAPIMGTPPGPHGNLSPSHRPHLQTASLWG